ncbi:MAG: hypothetical protein EOO88_35295 [Pedobacter sp.]|nr:MAG: hypothetical protein EOO88_35295 [Pedobacter sp.]
MKSYILIAFSIVFFSISLSSCTKPRIELDDSVWGDQAFITQAVLFKYTTVTNQLGYEEPVTGYQNTSVTTVSNIIDRSGATVTLVAAKGTDLTKIGIRFSHFAKKIEPLNGAPVAGVISDFSAGNFTYRVTSADGTVRDWRVKVSVAP